MFGALASIIPSVGQAIPGLMSLFGGGKSSGEDQGKVFGIPTPALESMMNIGGSVSSFIDSRQNKPQVESGAMMGLLS